MSKYTKEGLLKSLIALAEQLNRKPTKYDLIEHDLPSANTFRYYGISLGGDWLKKYLYDLNPSSCQECSTVLPIHKAENKFCGHTCSAIFNNKKNYGKSYVVPVLECLHCGQSFKGKNKTKYCTQSCMKSYQFIERFRDWYESGKSFGNRVIRDFLSTIGGYNCAHCGISEWNGKPITLEVEHIDGNSEDSSPENVCLLCPNCHSQTPTYKGRNKGNGRHKRRLRYQEGKSY